jgi:hypothetical protein
MVASPASSDVVCTLFEGDYHFGVAILINSLLRGGFAGTFRLGYRTHLPPWVCQLENLDGGETYRIDGQALAIFEKIDTKVHFANCKPSFLQQILDSDPSVERVFYFDPDIVSQASWPFYQRWADLGVALCEEAVNGTMPENHPLRLMWVDFMASKGWQAPHRPLSRYYNSGFIGVSRQRKAFLALWHSVLDEAATTDGVNLNAFMPGNREMPFYATDQDALNVAAMYSEEGLSTIGPEGMAFMGGGFTMQHANQGTKPWRKSFLSEAISGKPPLKVDRSFLQHAQGPIVPFSRRDLQQRMLRSELATAIGRFYRRYR